MFPIVVGRIEEVEDAGCQSMLNGIQDVAKFLLRPG